MLAGLYFGGKKSSPAIVARLADVMKGSCKLMLWGHGIIDW